MKSTLHATVIAMGLAWTTTVNAEAYALQVAGLSCKLCAYAVEQRLGQLEGVREVRVNLEDGRVTVRTRDGVRLAEEQARKVIQGAGFELTDYRELSPGELR